MNRKEIKAIKKMKTNARKEFNMHIEKWQNGDPYAEKDSIYWRGRIHALNKVLKLIK